MEKRSKNSEGEKKARRQERKREAGQNDVLAMKSDVQWRSNYARYKGHRADDYYSIEHASFLTPVTIILLHFRSSFSRVLSTIGGATTAVFLFFPEWVGFCSVEMTTGWSLTFCENSIKVEFGGSAISPGDIFLTVILTSLYHGSGIL